MCSAIFLRMTDIGYDLDRRSAWTVRPGRGRPCPAPDGDARPVIARESEDVVLGDAAADAGARNLRMSTLCSFAILRTSGDDLPLGVPIACDGRGPVRGRAGHGVGAAARRAGGCGVQPRRRRRRCRRLPVAAASQLPRAATARAAVAAPRRSRRRRC